MIRSSIVAGVCLLPPACLLAEWLWRRKRSAAPASVPFSAEPAKGWLPWGSLAPYLALVFVAAPALGISGVLEHFHLADAKGDPLGMSGLFAFLLVPFALTGAVVLAWVRFVERRPLATIGLAPRAAATTFARGHAIGLATAGALVAAIHVAGGSEVRGWARAFGSPAALADAAVLLACFVVQAGVEEILFRGWLVSVAARRFGVAGAVAITSAVFMLLHFSPHQGALVMLGTFLFSAFTCAWALAAGNVWGVMGWHAGWNWLLATGFELPITGVDAHLPALVVRLLPRGPEALTGGAQGPEGSALCSLLFAVAIAFVRARARARPES